MKNNSIVIVLIFIVLFSCNNNKTQPDKIDNKNESSIVEITGFALGTSYTIKYVVDSVVNYRMEINALLNDFENSMSPFRPKSIISRINNNDSTVVPDKYFIDCFLEAEKISEATDGAFDITVAPLVNAWGFGFDKKDQVSDELINDLMQHVGYNKVFIKNNKVIKTDPETMLDCSAIAKGQCVDVVCEFLEKKGISNYMVEIGGEVRAKGNKPDGTEWLIGIDKPIENSGFNDRQIQDVIALKDKAVATSGNYRQFYYKDGVKYSHTINPKTGYPVNHSLLSVSVLTDKCITADAYATAFMVLGYEKSLKIVEADSCLDAFFILSDKEGNYIVRYTKGFEKLIKTKELTH